MMNFASGWAISQVSSRFELDDIRIGAQTSWDFWDGWDGIDVFTMDKEHKFWWAKGARCYGLNVCVPQNLYVEAPIWEHLEIGTSWK